MIMKKDLNYILDSFNLNTNTCTIHTDSDGEIMGLSVKKDKIEGMLFRFLEALRNRIYCTDFNLYPIGNTYAIEPIYE